MADTKTTEKSVSTDEAGKDAQELKAQTPAGKSGILDKEDTPLPMPKAERNDGVNPLAAQAMLMSSQPKTADEREFGAGRWVFSTKFQRPVPTGTFAGSVDDRILLDAVNVEEALVECRERGLYTANAVGVSIIPNEADVKTIDGNAKVASALNELDGYAGESKADKKARAK